MKFIIKDDKFIVFLNKNQIKKTNFEENDLEKNFKNLFSNIKDKYNIEINGFYEINIYKDKHYGIILEVTNEFDYDYFNQVDMRINIIKDTFLYEINYNFIDKKIKKNAVCYIRNNKLYLKTNNIIPQLLELSNIIYGEEAKEILKFGKKVNI